MMNLSIFLGVQFSICLVVTTVGPATCFTDDGNGKSNSDVDTIRQKFNRQWKMIIGSSWLSASKSLTGDRNENKKVVTPSKNPSRQPLKLSDGFFSKKDRRYPKGKTTSVTGLRHVINRPKDIGAGETNATVRNSVPTTTTTISSDMAIFRTENECVSANNGRLCVCFMIDFLDSIGERLNEVAAENQTVVDTAFRCSSYKSVPASFVISPTVDTTVTPIDKTTTTVNVLEQNDLTNGIDNRTANVTGRREVDFNYIVNYQLEKSKNASYAVHYGLVGSDIRVQCATNSDDNNADVNMFKWEYTKDKTNSTIMGMTTNNLIILNLDPSDSKNYTCVSKPVRHSKTSSPYTHYVTAVKKQIYEIHGTTFYKIINSEGCRLELINNVRKRLPSFIRSEMCPEESSSYACNVDIETSKCVEDEVGTLEIKYLVTLNEKASYLTRIRISKKGQDVLFHQKLLARISKVLVENLNKSLTVPIMSQSYKSSIHTRIEPDNSRMKIKTYVSCSSGFGIREVFCAACPPHHYSPDKTADCLKCSKGFHQPIAGSEKCVKCPNIFASGCYMSEFPHMVHYVAGFVGLLVSLVLITYYLCCCREKNETYTDVENTLKKISRKLKKPNKYNKLSDDLTSSEVSDGSLLQQASKLKKLLRISKKQKQKNLISKIPFSKIHKEFGRFPKNRSSIQSA